LELVNDGSVEERVEPIEIHQQHRRANRESEGALEQVRVCQSDACGSRYVDDNRLQGNHRAQQDVVIVRVPAEDVPEVRALEGVYVLGVADRRAIECEWLWRCMENGGLSKDADRHVVRCSKTRIVHCGWIDSRIAGCRREFEGRRVE